MNVGFLSRKLQWQLIAETAIRHVQTERPVSESGVPLPVEAYPRAIAGRRFELRRALHKATLSATRHNLAIRTFYQRLLVAGKSKRSP